MRRAKNGMVLTSATCQPCDQESENTVGGTNGSTGGSYKRSTSTARAPARQHGGAEV